MSRHNRRRVRLPQYIAQQTALRNGSLGSYAPASEPPDKRSIPRGPLSRKNDLFAKHWLNRLSAWQVREKRQKEEKEKLKAEQRRLFGGDSQDGEEAEFLCTQMMDFFVGLDYLES
ncbi:hypothetical protein P7C71_g1475, partial [Lecanoromycetidae sp. Uapishka_2]